MAFSSTENLPNRALCLLNRPDVVLSAPVRRAVNSPLNNMLRAVSSVMSFSIVASNHWKNDRISAKPSLSAARSITLFFLKGVFADNRSRGSTLQDSKVSKNVMLFVRRVEMSANTLSTLYGRILWPVFKISQTSA